MPWGVEALTEKQRQQRIVEAGSDQIGGDNNPKYIAQLAEEGVIPTARLDASARRVLTPMFRLGLFENPYVDPDRADSVVDGPAFRAAGLDAQRRSMVLLKNDRGILPLRTGQRLYVDNIDKSVAARYGIVVDDVTRADFALIEVTAPFALRPNGTGFARFYKEGTLAYAGATNAAQLEAIRRLASSGTPTIVLMYLDRPAILTEFIDTVPALLAHFNASEEAMLDVVFGKASPQGKLPFDLPRTMESVERQLEDVPFDLDQPLFRFGFGLSYVGGDR
jgi:beta-glucosidase